MPPHCTLPPNHPLLLHTGIRRLNYAYVLEVVKLGRVARKEGKGVRG